MIYIDDPVIEDMFENWWDEDRGLHYGECYKCGASTTGSEKDIECWIYEHAKEHMSDDHCHFCDRVIGFYGCPTHGVDCYTEDDE